MPIPYFSSPSRCHAVVLSGLLFLSACGDGDDSNQQSANFDPDGVLNVTLIRTEYGVPHAQADNLESVAFGLGYAFAEDNLCLLADQVVKYNSKRSFYFGPDQVTGSGDSLNLINDFSYLALEIRTQAEDGLSTLSEPVRAMLSGYAEGYNHYLEVTPVEEQDPRCAGQSWVQPITEEDLLSFALGVTLLPGAGQFLAPMFLAAPPGESYLPTVDQATWAPDRYLGLEKSVSMPKLRDEERGSNGWALGRDKTEDMGGMLLANPHFPHTGNLRFWQFQATVPGVMDVMGASLTGMPGIVNIGFNRDLAWTHTVSTAQHFVVYQLNLDESDPSGMSYRSDGQIKQIERRPFVILVNQGESVVTMNKDFFFSDYGPMIRVPDQLPWGEDANGGLSAFSIKDANRNNLDLLEFWMALNRSGDMTAFQQAFRDYDGVIFNNTMAVDRGGNAFYIDDSTVPDLSATAELALTTDPTLMALREQAGFVILPGESQDFDYQQAVPYERAPKLQRTDFVQNSNDSYWLTNPESPLTGYATMYGPVDAPQSLRSRMGQRLLEDAAGTDQRFNLDELENALLGNRNYLGEETLESLLELCTASLDTPVLVDEQSVDLLPGCQALAHWDGSFNLESHAAHLFREFAQRFQSDPQWINGFDPADPLNTPNTLDANNTVLRQLAEAMLQVESAGLTLDATLGEVQFVERGNLDGTPTGEKHPWAGSNNVEGGFNVFSANQENDGTLLPRPVWATLTGSQLSEAAGGYPISFGSSWMMLVDFTPSGPQARGLLTYSQASNPASPYYLDQTRYYSKQPRLRPIWFEQSDIQSHAQSTLQLTKTLR